MRHRARQNVHAYGGAAVAEVTLAPWWRRRCLCVPVSGVECVVTADPG